MVLLAPGVESVEELLVRGRITPLLGRGGRQVTLPLERETSAAGDRAEVVQVGDDIKAKGATVAAGVCDTVADANITDLVVGRGGAACGQPELGGAVSVAEDDWGKTRNRVSGVGDAVLRAGLAGDEVCKLVIAYSWRAVAVDVHGEALAAHIGSSKSSNGTTERMTCGNELVARVGRASLANCIGSGPRNFVPGRSESSVNLAVGSKVAATPKEDNVGDKVANVVATTDGHHNLSTSVVNRNIATNACTAAPVIV